LALPCATCGFSNEPGEKFCGGCGQPLRSAEQGGSPTFISPESYTPKHLAEKILTSKAALEGERTQVTVLFADLKGSMELLADRDPEEARKLLTLDRALEPTLPALLALLDVPVDDAAWRTLDPGQRRQRTLDAVKRLLLRDAREQALLLIVEDLHLIDGETQAVLDGLVDRPRVQGSCWMPSSERIPG
jgi:hypothetical protein